MLVALLMAGGRGERFWPKSRSNHPKQLLAIASASSMIEETMARISPMIPRERVFVSTGTAIFKEMRNVLSGVPRDNFVIEPVGRNTASCIGLSALKIRHKFGNAVMVVLPADHVISDQDLFLRTVDWGAHLAVERGAIITMGIKPRAAHTGYGYIKHGEKMAERDGIVAHQFERFTEKPDRTTAERFLENGTYLWNSGMFIWTVETILDEIRCHLPDLDRVLSSISPMVGTPDEEKAIETLFPQAPNISIDYGIMEKTQKGIVLRGTFDWDDVGSWTSLERLHPRDDSGNILKGPCVTLDTTDCIIVSDKHLVGTIGVKDLIIIATDDAILVCHASVGEDVKKLVEEIRKNPDLHKYL